MREIYSPKGVLRTENKTRVLVTGGAGFIGHHLVEHIIKNTDWDIVVLDKLNYASNGLDRLRDISCFNEERVHILAADFAHDLSLGVKREIGQVDYIIHLGAETHVDKSIENPEPFVMSNVVGTMHMLNFAREQKYLKRFVMFSTDEVYGPALKGEHHKETDRYNAANPYAATKAGAEQLSLAYANTYKVPVIITNTMNVFGERQHPEKFIPLVIRKILRGEEISIHSNPEKTKAGSRYWIHARNVAAAILFLLDRSKVGESYNIVGEKEVDCLEMAKFVSDTLGLDLFYKMVDFHSSRPGHDLRYALDGTKLKNMGWELPKTFEESLQKTIEWTIENSQWLGAKDELYLSGSTK